jgi:YD repeat-containing protein
MVSAVTIKWDGTCWFSVERLEENERTAESSAAGHLRVPVTLHFRSRRSRMKTITIVAPTLGMITAASAQNQTTFRDASGRTTGTVTTDSNGTKTFRDGSGRTIGTATTNSNGTTTFRNEKGQTTGTATRSR